MYYLKYNIVQDEKQIDFDNNATAGSIKLQEYWKKNE